MAVAALCYIPWLLALIAAPPWAEPGSGGGETRISEAWGILLVLLFGIPLWLALGGLVMVAWRKGFAPPGWGAASALLYPLAAVATFAAARTYLVWPGGWSILVPALLPPLLAFYGLCLRVPTLTGGRMRLLPGLALCVTGLVALAAIPFASIDPLGYPVRLASEQRRWDAAFARRDAKLQEAALQWEQDIRRLGPESPLAAWLDYVNGSAGSELLHQQALEGARAARNRQADAVALLDNGQILRLAELSQFALTVTPALCMAYNQALSRLATTDQPFESEIGKQLELQVPNAEFLLAGRCDLTSGLGAAERRLRKVAAVNPGDEHWLQLAAALDALLRRHGKTNSNAG